MNKLVKNEYPDGECPDCGEPIPDDVQHEESCSNCGHIWNQANSDALMREEQVRRDMQRVAPLWRGSRSDY